MPSLTPEGVLADIQPIFRQVLNNGTLVITRESSAMNTPGWDSLTHLEMISMVERKYKTRFGLGQLQDLKTVGDLVDLIISKVG